MQAREKLRRFLATDTGRVAWRIATGIVIFPLVWLAMRPLFWLTMGDSMLARSVASFTGDTSSWQFWEMQRLLEWGADPDYRYGNDALVATPLFYAAAGGEIDLAELLLRHGASLTAVNSDGATAADVACFYGEAAMARYLSTLGVALTGRYETTSKGAPLPKNCAKETQGNEM